VTSTSESQQGVTIDQLAQLAGLPVRTIREYHTMRLLPAPERRGRVGFYGAQHIHRLELVARLQRRGYSLAGIRDLLQAWDAGTGLGAVLGVNGGPVAVDETPLLLTRAELDARLPGLDAATLQRALAIGLVYSRGPSHFLVRSPALIDLAADGQRLGLGLDGMLDQLEIVIAELHDLAGTVARSIVERIWQPATTGGHADELPGFLARGRLLLLQGVASMLTDRLGAALAELAADISGGDALLAALDSIRVGVVADAAGTLHQRGASWTSSTGSRPSTGIPARTPTTG
jgi:DNA-binding transcriptional MerR regulator